MKNIIAFTIAALFALPALALNSVQIDDTSHAATRTISAAETDARIGDISFNVLSYGADNQGVTDTTAEINDAIQAACDAGGGRVYFPDGTYKIGQSDTAVVSAHGTDLTTMGLIIPECTDVELVGAGRARTTLVQAGTSSGTANTAFIAILNATNIKIHGFEIDGGFTGSENGGVGIWGDSVDADGINENIAIYDNHIHHTRGYGLGLQYSRYHGVQIYDNLIEYTGADGIDFKNRETTQDNYGIAVYNNVFSHIGTRTSDIAFAGQVGIDCRGICSVRNNTFLNVGESGTYGDRVAVRLRPTDVSTTGVGGRYSLIEDNVIRATSGQEAQCMGIYAAGYKARIAFNDVKDCKASAGIILVVDSTIPDTADDAIVIGNNVTNFGANTGDYAFVSTSDRVKFIGNTADTGDTGFRYTGTNTINMGNVAVNTVTPMSPSVAATGSNRIGNSSNGGGGANIYDNGTSSVLLISPNTAETNKAIRLLPKGTGDVQLGSGAFALPHTITTPGTTGNQTINKAQGRVNIAAAGTSVTVTDSVVTSTSAVLCYLLTNDATAKSCVAVPSSGSFVAYLNAAATGEVAVGFTVLHGY